MRKSNFAKIVSFVFICAMLMGALAIAIFATGETTVEIVSQNVYFGEKYELMYAVNAPAGATVSATANGQDIDVVLYKTNPDEVDADYVYILAEGVAAQAIDTVITFTVSYGNETVSKNYSVLQYVTERTNGTSENQAEGTELAMFEAFIAFADAANVHINEAKYSFNDYVYVSVEGATVNGINPTGMYLAGATPFADLELALDFDEDNQILRWYADGEQTTLDAIKAIVVADKDIAIKAEVLDKCFNGHTWIDPTCSAAGYCDVCGVAGEAAVDHKDGNGDFTCDFGCGTIIEPAADSALTIEQAIALADLFAHNTYSTNSYYITGIITDVYNTTYGNAYITDASGKEFTVYGMYRDGVRYDAFEYKPIKGDEITVYGQVGKYNSTLQIKNAEIDEIVAHEHDFSEPDCTNPAVCSICGVKGDEAEGHNYVDGVCDRCGEEEPATGETVVSKADFDSITNTNTQYGNRETTNGWTAVNAAVLGGAASGNNSPNFSFISTDTSVRALCLNGKTTAVGKITSATLSGGISKITFNYGLPFSDSKIGLTVNIIQGGSVVATQTISNTSASKNTSYTFEWALDTVIEGDFVIEIVNNSPSNSTSNKDRTAIWNLEWTSAPKS